MGGPGTLCLPASKKAGPTLTPTSAFQVVGSHTGLERLMTFLGGIVRAGEEGRARLALLELEELTSTAGRRTVVMIRH